jgi:hypothetical protein
MVYSGAWGKLIHEKNQKSKISLHCPFKANTSWLYVSGLFQSVPNAVLMIYDKI